MKRGGAKLQRIFKGIFKSLVFLIFFIILLVALIGVFSNSPKIQTWLAKVAVEDISDRFGIKVGLDKLYLSGFRTLNLENVLILDHHQDTMISVPYLKAEISLKNIFSNNTLFLSDIELSRPSFYLHKTQEDTTFNINYFIQSISSNKPDSLKKEPIKVILEDLVLGEGRFILQNDTFQNRTDHFEANHIQYDQINAYLKTFSVHYDSVESQIDSLFFKEYPGKQNVSLHGTSLSMSKHHLNLLGMDLKYNNSRIKDSIAFKFNGWQSWTDFPNQVFFDGRFDKSYIRTNDIAFYLPQIKNYDYAFKLSGKAKGQLADMSLEEFDLHYGGRSYVKGDLDIEGLPELDNSIISLNISSSGISSADIKGFFGDDIQNQIENLKFINLTGRFEGFYYDFVADGMFKTALGNIRTDINFKLPDRGSARYSGSLASENFQLGKLFEREKLFQSINITAEIDGTGLSAKEADLKMNASLLNSSIYGYKYNEIHFNARLKENLFDGLFQVKDSSLNMEVNGLVNLDPSIEQIDITGEIKNANLKEINVTTKEGTLKGQLDLDFTGLSLDRTFGKADLKNIEVFYDDKYLFLDNFLLQSDIIEDQRDIQIISDLVEGRMTGDFRIINLARDLKKLLHEYKLQLQNQEDEISSYYATIEPTEKRYSAEWYLHFADVNPISSLLFPELYISQNTNINGRIHMGNTRIFNLYSEIDTVIFGDYRFIENEIDISTSKFKDSSEILAFVFLESSEQEMEGAIQGDALSFEVLWDNRNIDFNAYFSQLNDENYAKIGGRAIFRVDSTMIKFKDCDFRAIEKQWILSEENMLTLKKDKLKVENIYLSTGYESILINGAASDNPEDQLNIAFSNYNLKNFSPLINRDISGILNAEMKLSDIRNQMQIVGDVRANDCTIEGFLIGDITGSSRWDNNFKGIVSQYEINRLGTNIMTIEGIILPQEDMTKLNLMAKLQNTNLELVEPFTKGVISEISGKANGFLTLKGTADEPILEGSVNVKKGEFSIDYLNTHYTFEDRLVFNTDNIRANNLVLKDNLGNEAMVNGGIYHVGFSNPVIDLSGNLTNFKVLNTEFEDNDLFYGQARASGTINFLGAFSDIQIRADLESEKGTFVHIPLDNYTELEKESHITFLSEIDTTETLEILASEQIDLSGISMDFNLKMTPEAQMEIILDKQTGDIIKGNGNGELSLEIDTRGDFNMYGFYEIEEGSYNFTLLNVVNKEFNIRNGGRISWAGDPYEGLVDLTGIYSQNVSLKPLMLSADSIFLNSPQASRRHPVDVNLHLTGPLLSPEFDFGINIVNQPNYQGYDFNNDFLAFQNRIDNNQDVLNREVFSLIVLRQFSQNQSAIQQSAGNNLSELFTNQLSNYLSSVNENLEINLDISGLSQEDLNDLQLRFSYTFLEGRLRVTREGNFINAGNEADVSSVIGDWTIEYALTEDGRLKAKFFNRNNPNIYQTGSNTTTTTTGASLKYIRSFDKFDQILAEEKPEKKKSKNKSQRDSSPARKEDLESNSSGR